MKFYSRSIYSTLIILLLVMVVPASAQNPKRKKVNRETPLPVVKAHFVSGKSSLKIPFERVNNLTLLQAKINDAAPLWFILDTGATNTVIDTQLATALRLKSAGRLVNSGASGTAKGLTVKRVSLRFPNVEALDQTIATFPLDFLSAPLGLKVGGVIGNDILQDFVVEVDQTAQTINLYAPESYQYSGSGEIIPLTLKDGYPFIWAKINLRGRSPIRGKFELDSGSTSAILFNTPFVKRHQLLKFISKVNQVNVGGVGGTGRALIGRIESIELGRFALKDPVAQFFQGTRGDNASAAYDGLIGGEIFRRFKVIFDYSRRRMILEPNAQFAEAFEVDMSGLKLIAEGENFSTILVGNEVEAGSPAAEAGIEGEDIIMAIDGRPVKEFTLEQIRKMFMQDGKEYLIRLKRGDKLIETKLKLRRTI